MNIFYKCYCRLFQLSLRMLIPFLPYKNPIILNSIDELKKSLMENKKTKPLIITGKHIVKSDLMNYLSPLGDYIIYSNVSSNPTSENVYEALKVYKDNKCDSLIAFGGGSVIDLAKALGALYVNPKKDLNDLKGVLHVKKKIPLLYAIPTTCGTGSETTLASVVTDSKTKHKFAINDFCLIPSYAILDYRLLKSLPSDLIATTGLDALTHALEAYIGRSTTYKSRKDALEAIKLIFDNLLDAYLNKQDKALENMLIASHKAGRAFSVSYVGYVHAIAHSLGGKYNIPHGYANGVILPYVLNEYKEKIYKKIGKIVDYIYPNNNLKLKEKYAYFMDKLLMLEKELKIKNTIEIKEEDIDELATNALKEANPLYPVPKLFGKKEIKKIYYKIRG